MDSSYEEMMKTKPYLPFNMGGCLTEAMIAKARKELGETEEVKAKTIPELRKLIQAEPDFYCPTDDCYLLQHLRARKFNVQKAFTLIKNLSSVKKANPDLFNSYDDEAMLRRLEQNAGYILPYRDADGCVIGVINMHKWDVEVTSAEDAIILLTVAVMMAAQEPASQICGLRMLIDMRGTTLKQIRSLIPKHVILLAKTLIHVHGDSQENLHKFIPKAILPAEVYGGDNTNDVAAWFNIEVQKYFELYQQMTTYGYKQ